MNDTGVRFTTELELKSKMVFLMLINDDTFYEEIENRRIFKMNKSP